jgi:hypothetical protein
MGRRRSSRSDTVHIERAEEHVVFRQDLRRKENRKPKKVRLRGNGGELAAMISRGSNDRDDIADLTVERGTDLIEDIRMRVARRDGLKNLFFESE